MSPSALSRLLRPVEPLTPAMSISDVADRLLMPEHRAFLSLPVVDDERRVLGLVSRYTLRTSSCSVSAATSGAAIRCATS